MATGLNTTAAVWVVAGLVTAAGIGGYALGRDEVAVPPPPVSVDLTGEERTTISLFRAARDSVVSISTSDRLVDPWTRRTVDQPLGSGSGFVWDEAGHIVTNDHVIDGATSAIVSLADGRTYSAQLVGRDPSHDLAVLRIDADDLPAPLPLGRSGDLEVGQDVLAIGNPFGLDWTLTTGIVSALDRELESRGGRPIRGLIQTDAAINPGNSGGPLLDSAGRLIGVNTAIFSPSGASAGIGFAVPVNTLRRVVPQLVETGRYLPPTLGLEVDARINAAVNRQGLPGVLILGVRPGSPAAEAGLRAARIDRAGRLSPGDIIVAVDGTPVEDLDTYQAVIDQMSPGDEVTVTLRSGRRERDVRMALVQG